jgi:hypothetical protein
MPPDRNHILSGCRFSVCAMARICKSHRSDDLGLHDEIHDTLKRREICGYPKLALEIALGK